MKKVFTLILGLYFTTIFSQQTDYNITNNFLAGGYDVVSYFEGKAEKGNDKFIYKYDGILLKFKTKAHQRTFILNPKKYLSSMEDIVLMLWQIVVKKFQSTLKRMKSEMVNYTFFTILFLIIP